jgi:hypothetical protein
MARVILLKKDTQERIVKQVCQKCERYVDLSEYKEHKRTCSPPEHKVTLDNGDNPHLFKRDLHLKNKYGITFAIYRKMYLDQERKCAICGKHEPLHIDKRLPFVVDHCHSTNIVRGLLCNRCNLAIGMFKDDPISLRNAFRYLTGDVTDFAAKPSPQVRKARRKQARKQRGYNLTPIEKHQDEQADETYERFLNAIAD